MIKLSYKAIQTMMFEGNGKNDQYVVETSNFKSKAGYLTFEIKDQLESAKGVLFLGDSAQSRQTMNIPEICEKVDA